MARIVGSNLSSKCRSSMNSNDSGDTSSSRRGEKSGELVGENGRSRLDTRASTRRSARTTYKISSAYSSLATLTIVLLAMSMLTSASASLSCKTDSDCTIKGVGKCKQHTNGEATCQYTSCAAGFYGAGNTYTDCFECPNGMTSLAGKAFYNTDCFLQCGDERCYVPEDGYAECSIESSTAKHVCLQTCNQEGYAVLNPSKPYATCVKEGTLNRNLTNQASRRKVVITKVPKLKRYYKRGAGKRLKADVLNLLRQGQAPAAALLKSRDDPLALVSK